MTAAINIQAQPSPFLWDTVEDIVAGQNILGEDGAGGQFLLTDEDGNILKTD